MNTFLLTLRLCLPATDVLSSDDLCLAPLLDYERSPLLLRRFLVTWLELGNASEPASITPIAALTPADAVLAFCERFRCGKVTLPLSAQDAEIEGTEIACVWTASVGDAIVVVREPLAICVKSSVGPGREFLTDGFAA